MCSKALNSILSEYGLKLPPGQGFHITRKTFATRLLTAGTEIDHITNALGHTTRDTVDSYLAHAEDGMRFCPLSFMIGGPQ
jgi:integrase